MQDGQIIADDFICSDESPITAVRWWGGYGAALGQDPRPTGYVTFDISFHYSTETHPRSVPGNLIVLFENVSAQEEYVDYNSYGDPVYRYDVMLPDAFDQWLYSQSAANGNQGELFINIAANNADATWAWQGCQAPHPRANDYGAYSLDGHAGPWTSLDAAGYQSDLTFELMTPEPTTLGVLALGMGALLSKKRRSRKTRR